MRKPLLTPFLVLSTSVFTLGPGFAAPTDGVKSGLQPPPAEERPGGAAAGQMPQHLPPILVGALADQNAQGDTITLRQLNGQPVPATIHLEPYTEFRRLVVADPGAWKQGDTVMLQGRGDPVTDHFTARVVIRLEHRLHLAPGVELLTAVPTEMPSAETSNHSPLSNTTGVTNRAAPVTGTTGDGSANSAAGGAKGATASSVLALRALRARQRVKQALRQGRVQALVVSLEPMTVELFDGETLSVDRSAATLMLEQLKADRSQMVPGGMMRLEGSEVGPGRYRAAAVDLAPAGLFERLFQTGLPGVRRRDLRRFGNRRRR